MEELILTVRAEKKAIDHILKNIPDILMGEPYVQIEVKKRMV